MKVKALYNFLPQSEKELPFVEGAILHLLEDRGQGWSYARDPCGKEGLIPSEYVEPFIHPNIDAPPPAIYASQLDDDWDSDEDDLTQARTYEIPADSLRSSHSSINATTSDPTRCGAVRKAFGRNRFGADEFLLQLETPENIHPIVYINFIDGLPHWQNAASSPVTCNVGQRNKSSKFGGVISFINYRVTSSLIPSHVERRYNQFEWLHLRLLDKFPVFCPPAFPPKGYGRPDGEEFLDERSRQLQWYMDWCCSHPVISKLPVFHHFLSAVDEKRWKQGKRQAENDTLQWNKFFFMVNVEDDESILDCTVDSMDRMSKKASRTVRDLRGVLTAMNELQNNRATNISKDFFELSEAISKLSRTLDTDVFNKKIVADLVVTFVKLSEAVKAISLHHSVKSNVLTSFDTVMTQNIDLLSNMDIPLALGRKACATLEEAKRMKSTGKLGESDLNLLRSGCRIMSFSAQAECNFVINHLRSVLVAQMESYLRDQAAFYRQVADELDTAANLFKS